MMEDMRRRPSTSQGCLRPVEAERERNGADSPSQRPHPEGTNLPTHRFQTSSHQDHETIPFCSNPSCLGYFVTAAPGR